MNRSQKKAIILNLVETLHKNESWCGETHIQKTLYCLQELTNVPIEFNFIIYKHGPFSFDLRDELTAMRADGLLEIQINPYPYGPSLFPTTLGESIQNIYPKTLKRYEGKMNFIAKTFGSMGVATLERLATALYITQENDSKDIEERVEHIHKLKPHISLDQARIAIKKMDKIVDKSHTVK